MFTANSLALWSTISEARVFIENVRESRNYFSFAVHLLNTIFRVAFNSVYKILHIWVNFSRSRNFFAFRIFLKLFLHFKSLESPV
jgi:hypothetical protein